MHYVTKVQGAWEEIGCPKRVLIALSGGSDSVALFCILKKLSLQCNLSIAAVHVHHGIRKTADRDAAFCQQLCKKHQVPFFVHYLSLHSSGENEARQARYAAFADVYATWQADSIALAHHKADQAETVLLHLFRGSGSKGLCGMTALSEQNISNTRMRIWRPLLQESKETLLQLSSRENGLWCDDETNETDVYTRNFLRLQILPAITKRIPNAEENICRAASILQAEQEWMDETVQAFLDEHACKLMPLPFLETAPFSILHVALRRRIMHSFLSFLDPTSEHILPAADIKASGTVNLPKGYVLKASENRIYLLPPGCMQTPIPPLVPQLTAAGTGDGIRAQSIPASLYDACVLRYRKPGDFIQPFGMTGTKALQDYLVDRKVDAPLRDHIPLLCLGSEVIWAIGVGASEKVRCTEEEESILYTYPARLPYELI